MTHDPDAWWWRSEDDAGTPVDGPDDSEQEFPTRADAESWVGETWAELAEAGVAQVRLFQGEREVYGPMPLSS